MAHRSIRYHRPWMYAKQEEAIFHPARYAIIEATTKAGKTIGAINWLLEQAWTTGKAGRHYWWIAPNYKQAKIAYGRICRGLTRGAFTNNGGDLTITLDNGAILEFKSGENPDGLYGEDVYAAVIDEATRCREEAWYAVRSTLTQTRGPVRLIGNVKGRKNWAYQLARRAESGEPDMHYALLTAYDAVDGGVMDPAEIEDAKRILPEAVFNELYLGIPSDDGGNPFGITAIAGCTAPLSLHPPVCFGIDLAKSQDWTVVIGLDAERDVCFYDRWQGPWELTEAKIGAIVAGRPALVDSTGVGDRVVESLQRDYGPHFTGFLFSQRSKQQIVEGLAIDIQRDAIHFPTGEHLSGCVIVPELEAFEYQYTRTGVLYSAPTGLHDDAVYALALAREHHTHQPRAVFRDTDITAAVDPSLEAADWLFSPEPTS